MERPPGFRQGPEAPQQHTRDADLWNPNIDKEIDMP